MSKSSEYFIGAWKDKTIYQKAKGCFFIQCIKFEDGTYNVMVDSMWKDSWTLPLGGAINSNNNPKCYFGLTEEQFNETFERNPHQ